MIFISLLLLLGVLEYKGYIWHTAIFAIGYEVRGLDVSHHQGKIDWNRVKKQQDFRYVYIKATEGNDFVDDQFSTNWYGARKVGLFTGAYHFFSMGSPASEQATNFIRTVPKEKRTLPPVIDVEIPLQHNQLQVRSALLELVKTLEGHYHKKPILYVTYNTYLTYIKGHFSSSDIWIRDIYFYPDLEGRDWFMWQYSNRGRVDGIDTYVDINAYRGKYQKLVQIYND